MEKDLNIISGFLLLDLNKTDLLFMKFIKCCYFYVRAYSPYFNWISYR